MATVILGQTKVNFTGKSFKFSGKFQPPTLFLELISGRDYVQEPINCWHISFALS
jgi:hypothetical protein